jgi:hypothetical protein
MPNGPQKVLWTQQPGSSVFAVSSPRLQPSRSMALRATEGTEKPSGGEDAANEWRVEAGFSTERSATNRRAVGY